jgi:hypothetical protein
MTSLLSGTKQMANDSGYFINVGSLVNRILARTEPATNSGTAGGSFSTAVWATIISPVQSGYPAGQSPVSSLFTAGGAVLKDMGRTVVSSLRTFRKVQLVVPAVSTFGVGGTAGVAATPGQDYFTGYIELGFEGTGTPAPVAAFGR